MGTIGGGNKMSWVTCQDCGMFVNSDCDPDVFLEVGNWIPGKGGYKTEIVCEHCREEREAEAEKQAFLQAEWERVNQ